MMVSIIVPIYNAEGTLKRCIDSILRQTYKNYELLIINDGSHDSSKQICLAYANENSCIHYIEKENGGVSSARNLGIKVANGDYVTFVDSDDSIEQTFLEHLVMGTNADLVLSGFHSSEGIVFIPKKENIDETELPQVVSRLVEHEYMLYTPWAKLFKREILNRNHIIFDTSLRLYEDTIFVLSYLLSCKKLCVLDYDGYTYDGVWGGISKYRLTKEEVEYRCQREYEVLTRIEYKFHCKINKQFRCFAIDYVDDLFVKFTDDDCLELYGRYHSDREKNIYLSSRYSFPTYKAISLLKSKICNLDRDGVLRLISKLSHFFTIPMSKLNFAAWDEKMIYLLLKSNKQKWVYAYLLFYSYVKNVVYKLKK